MQGSDFWKDVKSENELLQASLQCEFISESERGGVVPRFLQSDTLKVSPNDFSANVISIYESKEQFAKVDVQIIFCGLIEEKWSFDKITNPYTLFDAVETFIEQIGVMPSYPVRTTIQCVKQLIKRKIELPKEIDLLNYFEPFLSAPDASLLTLRNLDLTERGAKYIHAFDKRSMFLSACSSLAVGEGEYEIIENQVYEKGMVGLFEVEFEFDKKIGKPFFTKLVNPNGFYYSALLDFLSDFTGQITIKKGYLWRETNRTLEAFYKKISTAKKETSDNSDAAISAANGAIKSLYTEFFGFLRKRENANDFKRAFFRPDWRGLIVSQAVANLLRNAFEVQNKILAKPFAIYHDCLMFASNEKDFNKFAENTCLADANKFSHEWTMDAKQVFDTTGKAKLKLVEIDSLGKENG